MRVTQLKYGIKDLRLFHADDLRYPLSVHLLPILTTPSGELVKELATPPQDFYTHCP